MYLQPGYHVTGDSLTQAPERLEAELVKHHDNARLAGDAEGWPILPK